MGLGDLFRRAAGAGGHGREDEGPPAASVTAEMVRALREETGCGVMACKSALLKAKGDAHAARALLKGTAGDRGAAARSPAPEATAQRAAPMDSRSSTSKCDICGRTGPVDVHPPFAVVDATAKGYVPSRLPPTWEVFRGTDQLASSWQSLVNLHSSSPWEICSRCMRDVQAAMHQAR